MNLIDACVVALLTVMDFAFLVHLRRWYTRVTGAERIMRGLEFALRHEIEQEDSLTRESELLPG
jgi:hypothetical protein